MSVLRSVPDKKARLPWPPVSMMRSRQPPTTGHQCSRCSVESSAVPQSRQMSMQLSKVCCNGQRASWIDPRSESAESAMGALVLGMSGTGMPLSARQSSAHIGHLARSKELTRSRWHSPDLALMPMGIQTGTQGLRREPQRLQEMMEGVVPRNRMRRVSGRPLSHHWQAAKAALAET